jgi:hypothetical protein
MVFPYSLIVHSVYFIFLVCYEGFTLICYAEQLAVCKVQLLQKLYDFNRSFADHRDIYGHMNAFQLQK